MGVVAQAGEEIVGDAAGFEGAGWLEGFEFEEDSAEGWLDCELGGVRGGGGWRVILVEGGVDGFTSLRRGIGELIL